MSWRDWWREIKEQLFTQPKEHPLDSEPKKRFVPPHASQPEGKPQPEWPPKDKRQ